MKSITIDVGFKEYSKNFLQKTIVVGISFFSYKKLNIFLSKIFNV